MTPKVSVVIPNYNYGRFLAAAIDSVLSQGLAKDDLQVVVVDDGSTDDSRRVLAGYAGRVEILLQPNQGQATAINNGIAASCGEIVCLLDADDVWLPGKLAKVVACFDRHPDAGVVEHLLQDTDASLRPLPREFPAWPERLTLEDFLEGRCRFTATSGLSYRRDVVLKALPLPRELFFCYCDDFLTVHSLFLGPGANLPEVLGCHRIHGSNFYADAYSSAKKLAGDLKNRRIFRENLDRWLAARGKRLSPRHERLEGLELMRREVLFHMLDGRRLDAARAWWRGMRRGGGEAFSLFRAATCALALASPGLYLAVYRRYADSGWWRDVRRRLFPA